MLAVVLLAIALLCATALAAGAAWRSDRAVLGIGGGGALLACTVGLGASVAALKEGTEVSLRSAWPLPVGQLHVGLDPLSAFFLLCVFAVSGLAALYGFGYLRAYLGKRRLAPVVVFFNVLVAAMAAVVIARDGVLFLIAWEAMSVASFFLVTHEDEHEEVRRAGMTYLVASHLGVAFLFLLFGLLSRHAGSLDFAVVAAAGSPPAGLATACFLLALAGFGAKAGFWPLHVWLPDAHSAAPSHVSAVMSGVMIKMGVYGLLRTLTLLGTPPPWWGLVVLAIGAVSGIAGVVHALAQHDLKRLLAYHSVENVGIITLGIGVGLLGRSHGSPEMAFLGYGGALLHVLNHGLFKGLLFQAAGSVFHATGTRDIDSLGGLYRRMPVTASAFLVGAVAISGLPPLNGFVSEWLIYVGAFRASDGLPLASTAPALSVIPALALIGGLAAACFVKAFGIVFLGEPRTAAAAGAHEAPKAMAVAMASGAALCVAIGLWPLGALRLIEPAVAPLVAPGSAGSAAIGPLGAITRAAILLLAFVALLALLRAALLRGAEVRSAETWACGYGAVTPRMQYTAASFAEPVLAPFSVVLHRSVHLEGPTGYFPAAARHEEHLGDLAGERFFLPVFRRFVELLGGVRAIQQGRLQLYLGYVFATLLALLVLLGLDLGGFLQR